MTDSATLPDWIASVFTAGAVGVSLWTTWLTSKQRREDVERAAQLRTIDEEARRQGIIHQISLKLSALASEAGTTLKDLNPRNKSAADLVKETDPFEIIGSFSPNVGYEDTMVRELATAEQNLLMLLNENDFLMDFSECLARNESIRRGLLEYKVRREGVLTLLPSPQMVNGQIVSFYPSQSEKLALAPHVIPLGSMVVSMRSLAAINMQMLVKLCADYQPMMMKHFPTLNIHTITVA